MVRALGYRDGESRWGIGMMGALGCRDGESGGGGVGQDRSVM